MNLALPAGTVRRLSGLAVLIVCAMLASAQAPLRAAGADGGALSLIAVPETSRIASGSAVPVARFELANLTGQPQQLSALTLHLSNPALFDAIVLTRPGMPPLRIDHPQDTAQFELPASLQLAPGASATFAVIARAATPALTALGDRWLLLRENLLARSVGAPPPDARPLAQALVAAALIILLVALLPRRWLTATLAAAAFAAGCSAVPPTLSAHASDMLISAVSSEHDARAGAPARPVRVSTITRL
ncbi:MAG TPA: hypothetical protein VHE37_10245 [Nevskiaceae bacterium]|nr:hypothetical protein [Nevskiaceae bacterium]